VLDDVHGQHFVGAPVRKRCEGAQIAQHVGTLARAARRDIDVDVARKKLVAATEVEPKGLAPGMREPRRRVIDGGLPGAVGGSVGR
jgi:hypothetical protein